MANNIDVTPGTGKTVAAEEVSSVIYQQVKLIDATAASVAPTGVAANPLQVSIANTGLNGTPIAVATHPVTNVGTFAVQVTAALPAGANAIGKLAANSGVDIGDVDVTSVLPGAGSTNLGKLQDASAASGHTGVAALMVESATGPTNFGVSDGDYSFPTTVNGAQWAAISATVGGALSPTKIEDVASAGGDAGIAAMAIQKATPANTAADGDYSMLQMSAGRLWVDPSGVTLTVAAHGVTNSGYTNAAFSVNHAPAANTKATITRASAGGGLKNVCTGFTVSLTGQSTAPAAVQLSVALIDGTTGGTTYLWGPQVIAIPAIAGAFSAFVRSNLFIPGTANTAMTLEFSAAGGANTIESVSFEGTTA